MTSLKINRYTHEIDGNGLLDDIKNKVLEKFTFERYPGERQRTVMHVFHARIFFIFKFIFSLYLNLVIYFIKNFFISYFLYIQIYIFFISYFLYIIFSLYHIFVIFKFIFS